MNFNQIQYLLAVYELGSITKAAQELFVSPPSISIAIRNLEEELECPLVLRTRHGITFTEQGKKAVHLMEEINRHYQELHTLKYDQHSEICGQITLGNTPHVNYSMVLPTLINVKTNYPKIEISMIDADSQEILKQVAQGILNLGIILFCNVDQDFFLQAIHRNHLQFSALLEDEMCFVVREDHPLTKLAHISIKDILSYPYFTYTEAVNSFHIAFYHRYNPNHELIQINDRDVLRKMLLYSNGCTAMPLSNKKGTLEQFSGLTFLHPNDFSYRCTIGWIHRQEALTTIENIIIDALQKEVLSLK